VRQSQNAQAAQERDVIDGENLQAVQGLANDVVISSIVSYECRLRAATRLAERRAFGVTVKRVLCTSEADSAKVVLEPGVAELVFHPNHAEHTALMGVVKKFE
jgi:hypothetical protein